MIYVPDRQTGVANPAVLTVLLACALLCACSGGLNPSPSSSDFPMKPGSYPIARDLFSKPITMSAGMITLFVTVESVTVNPDYSIIFNFKWYVEGKTTDPWWAVVMHSDKDNPNKFLTDSAGRRFDHILTTGQAYDGFNIPIGAIVTGSYTFGPIDPTVTSLVFHDLDSGHSITLTCTPATDYRLLAPTVIPPGGAISSAYPVELASATPGASIVYTLDGRDPEVTSGSVMHGTLYTSPFTLPPSGAATLKAMAFKSDWTNSSVARAAFSVSNPVERMAGNGIIPGGTSSTGEGLPAVGIRISPTDLALDSHDNLFFSDMLDRVVRRVDAGTGINTIIAGTFGSYSNIIANGRPATESAMMPGALAFDTSDNLYIVVPWSKLILKVDHSTGVATIYAGGGTSTADGVAATDADLNLGITDIAVDSRDRLFISCAERHKIFIVDPLTKIISTYAGTGAAGFSGDGGQATSAQLRYPWSLCLDAAGNLFVVMEGRIRKIDGTSGVISTIAGTGVSGYSGDGGSALSAEIYPTALCAAPDGSLYLINATTVSGIWGSVIRSIDQHIGIIQTTAGAYDESVTTYGRPVANFKLGRASDIALDSSGKLYIARTYEYEVARFMP